ncbi:alpha--glucanase [Lasallia pustulata]|uniref:Alpha--glucanase n=1 Tax=Lasallia pustulata TaxID=136370 RepID=A0A1W5D4B5_9LECA|nr:alpha--glucanase [Lasallia pustulata]
MFLAHCLAVAMLAVAGAMQTHAKAVFAHFIVGNSASSTPADWNDDINKAKAAGIDGFALNIAPGVSYTNTQLTNAYQAANAIGGFSLFLSFDYLATGPWVASDVINTIETYAGNPSQYRYNNQPLVSTFEGTNNIGDWPNIKAATGCFFVPDWTSLGPAGFQNQAGTADGAFSWDAWPQYPNAEVQSDQAWISALGSKPYMMGVPPWFYTNLPGKNWLWPSNDLWYNRWQQAIQYQPELVEIISWNDYGESHYIGPIRSPGIPSGAARYVDNMPHDDWRAFLPFYIAA